MIVIALDHRDGSSPIQYVRETAESEAHVVYPVKISHEPCDEVYEARDKQLRIRLWEISMAYEALMKIDAGQEVENLDSKHESKTERACGGAVAVRWEAGHSSRWEGDLGWTLVWRCHHDAAAQEYITTPARDLGRLGSHSSHQTPTRQSYTRSCPSRL